MKKYIFISSTISDLKEERDLLKHFLEDYKPIFLKCLVSEAPDFPVHPPKLLKNTYQICIDNLLRCDYVIQLLNRRYGIPDIEHGRERISILHKEYREAYRKRLPTFTLVHGNLWNAYNAYRRKRHQNYIDPSETKLFKLLDEVQGHPRKKWIFRYRNISDIKTIIKTNLFNFDDSIFIADVTCPDGTQVQVKEKFEKVWEIKNNGMITWKNRFLKEENPGCGLKPDCSLIPIPLTPPGKSVRIKATFTAPTYPSTCESYWKMVNASGSYFFPWKKGIWCRVKVVY